MAESDKVSSPSSNLPSKGVKPPLTNERPNMLQRYASTFKFLFIGFLILLMLIPLAMVGGVMHERKTLRRNVQKEISHLWGGQQTIQGPLLVVPYKETTRYQQENKAVQKKKMRYAFLLPDTLTMDGKLLPEERYRGIYKAVVYSGTSKLNAHFNPLTLERLQATGALERAEDVQWKDAFVLTRISDIKGIQPESQLSINGKKTELLPGGKSTGIIANVKGLGLAKPLDVEMTLALHGSQSLQVAPMGKTTTVSLAAPWHTPSFDGGYLPSTREVSSEGFNASWGVSYFARPFNQEWGDRQATVSTGYNSQSESKGQWESVKKASFGVKLLDSVDFYRQIERSHKYGVLFLSLTFLALFLFEQVAKVKIHVLQYSLVGLALALFYLILLAFSEVIGFLPAYIAASVAITSLISYYTLGIIRSKKQAWIMPGLLTVLYSYLYILLRLEDYSLLAGTVGLFIALAVVMRVTRDVDWFASTNSSSTHDM